MTHLRLNGVLVVQGFSITILTQCAYHVYNHVSHVLINLIIAYPVTQVNLEYPMVMVPVYVRTVTLMMVI